MSDKGEKTCPLCAEEMDLTDQQLKPCKCGYDICVWCWHHIMDMAEKDGTEGLCPACRVPYDKEKIVGMAADGRMVAEISTERKVKSQKSKGKPSEGRKQLSSVRVVQRNLVYVVGLPLNLGDEDLLQHKEYFGRYGKILKVSMSRTSTGSIQQFPNNTCSVYITYSKEEEAARCIQAVHGFTLEGRPLRACFGTTKYCHAWLRNMPCSNPDCLYLHEFGSQVDSFTKDEIVSAHTRVQEITGATTNLKYRSGNVLPPPLDESASSCAAPPGKLVANNASNTYPSLPSSTNLVKGSPPGSSSGRPASLPSGASWGLRGSSSQPSMTSTSNCVPPGMHKANATGVPMAFSSVVASTVPKSAPDSMKKLPFTDDNQSMEAKVKLGSSRKKHTGSELHNSSSNNKDGNEASFPEPHLASEYGILKKSDSIFPVKSAWDDDSTDDDLYTGNRNASNGHLSSSGVHLPADEISNSHTDDMEKPPSSDKLFSEIITSEGSKLTFSESPDMEEQHVQTLLMPSQVSPTMYSEVDEDVRSFNNQRLNDTQVVARPPQLSNQGLAQNVSNPAREMPIYLEDNVGSGIMNGNSLCTGVSGHDGFQLHASSARALSSRYNNYLTGEDGCLVPVDNQMKKSESNVYNGLYNATDLGENSIISDILSMDLESDGSLAAHNLASLLSDVDKPSGSQLLSTSWNAQSNNNNHSRFSFARHEEPDLQTYSESSNPNFRQPSFSQNVIESRNQYLDKVGHNSIGFDTFDDYNTASRSQAAFSSNRLSASRASPISAPPGFSIPNRTVPPPPPGFTSFERADHTYNAQPGHSFNPLLFRSSAEALLNGNMYSNVDIEFMDPAILAVGKGRLPIGGNNNYEVGMRSNLRSELDAFENEARLKLLMERSLTPQSSLQNGFSFPNDPCAGAYAQKVEHRQFQGKEYSQFVQNLQPRNGLVSSGKQGNEGLRDLNSQHSNDDITALDLIMKERLGLTFNNSYSNGYGEAAFRMPSSAESYKRSLGR